MARKGDTSPDSYLAGGAAGIRGMSSMFSLEIVSAFLALQNGLGIRGDVAEFGVFEGRMFVALALGRVAGEKAVGIDTFDWPSTEVLSTARTNTARWCADDDWRLLRLRSDDVVPGQGWAMPTFRFVHVDADHTYTSLRADLDRGARLLTDGGVLCLDDMVHPEFPDLTCAVFDFVRGSSLELFCVVDRQDFIGAAKFLLGPPELAPSYRDALAARFPHYLYPHGVKTVMGESILLTPAPQLNPM